METEGVHPRPQGQRKPRGAERGDEAPRPSQPERDQESLAGAWTPPAQPERAAPLPRCRTEAEGGACTSPATAQDGSVPASPREIPGLRLPIE